MTRVCTVCAHPDRKSIDNAIVGGGTERVIARQYGVSHDAVGRHRDHIAAKIEKALVAEGRTLVGLLDKGHRVVDEVLDGAEDDELRLKAVDRLAKLMDLEFGRTDKLKVEVTVGAMSDAELDAELGRLLASMPDDRVRAIWSSVERSRAIEAVGVVVDMPRLRERVGDDGSGGDR